MSSIIKVSTVHYPESDGKPMGESDEHRDAMVRHIELLKDYFDPDQEYLDPPLQGNRFVNGAYVLIEPDENGCLASHELGLRLCVEEGELQFYRLNTGQRLLTAREQASNEAEARQRAEAEVARLREELARRPPAE